MPLPDDQRRRLEQSCPRLAERGHGSWYFHCSAANLFGCRERARRGGYPSRAAAQQARDAWRAGTAADRTTQGWTVERWLRHWLDTRTSIRPTTRFQYTRDVENALIPHFGAYRLADLDAGLLRTVFAKIAAITNSKGRPQSASAMQHLRTTLRAALNLAVKEGVLDCNPARHIDQGLPAATRQGPDRRPRRILETDRCPPRRRGLDRKPPRRVPRLRHRRLPVRVLVARRATRTAPRRTVRTALD